jgi:DNA-binding transcriptional MerR regulator
MSELVRSTGVPAPTIKHYIREGLLPAPKLRTSRNMAYYDPALVPRIRAIKEAQRSRFLPLAVIRDALDGAAMDAPLEDAMLVIERTLKSRESAARRTRAELLTAGLPAEELDFFVSLGVVTPTRGEHGAETFGGDDLALLQTLGAARRAGISPSMLPHTVLGPYVKAIRDLVRVELEMFRTGVLPRAGKDLPSLVESATALSEQLVVLLRRKLLLPLVRELIAASSSPSRAKGARRRARVPRVTLT